MRTTRTFFDVEPMTITRPMPLGIGLYGYAGRGKSESAARLAEGMQRVYGGEVFYADTDGSRGLALRDRFKFRYIEFPAPHNALDFADLLRQFSQRKGVLVIDQMTEEHEGEDGLLDTHDKRKGGDERKTAVAWALAKSQHKVLARELRRALITIPVIVCWRAQDKIDWNHKGQNGKTEPQDLGEMPIGSRDLPFEMTATYLLPTSGERGQPCLNPTSTGEILMTKIPEQFRNIVQRGQTFTAAHGEAFARWAVGTAANPEAARLATALEAAPDVPTIETLGREVLQLVKAGTLTKADEAALKLAAKKRRGALAGGAPPEARPSPRPPTAPPPANPEDFDRTA